jgi:uncharacterized protein (TIGR04255 family)
VPFPEVERVIYKNNPIERVICQFRFPAILRIDAEVPADFQDKIRSDFPGLTEKTNVTIQFPQGLEGQMPPEVSQQLAQSSGTTKNYEFGSEDGIWQVNLTRTFLALSTRDYPRWEVFKKQLEIPFESLIEMYSPSSFSRIGLRYVDVIKRSKLGIPDIGWDKLLQPYVAGLLSPSMVSDNITSFETRSDILLSDGQSVVRVIAALRPAPDDGEMCFVIDSDFHNSGRFAVQDVTEKLDYLHSRASRLFRWCITDQLHEAMEPVPV